MNFNCPSHKLRLSSFLPLQATKEKANTPLLPKTPNSQQQRNSSKPSAIRQGRGQIPTGSSFSQVVFLQRSSKQPDSTGPEPPPAAHPAGLPTSGPDVRQGVGWRAGEGRALGSGRRFPAEPTPPPWSDLLLLGPRRGRAQKTLLSLGSQEWLCWACLIDGETFSVFYSLS